MTDYIFDFVRLVIVPVTFYVSYHILDRIKPEFLVKYKRPLLVFLLMYMMVFFVGCGLFNASSDKETPKVKTPTKQDDSDFFKEPKKPVKGQGPGFVPLSDNKKGE